MSYKVENRRQLLRQGQRIISYARGAGEQGRRHFDAQRLRRLQVDDELEFCWRLHRQVGGLFSPQNAIYI
jgi:hypothetical protein